MNAIPEKTPAPAAALTTPAAPASAAPAAAPSSANAPAWRNLVEPPALVELFLRHPPQGFAVERLEVGDSGPGAAGPNAADPGLPVFFTDFDLLTTLDAPLRRRVIRLPLYRFWSKLFRFPTLFAGTTVTEYAPVPEIVPMAAVFDSLLGDRASKHSLTIIKDVPWHSPLLSAQDNIRVHFLALLADKRGFIQVEGQALAYVPLDFASPEDYLSRLSPGRRKDLRRKLKSRQLLDVETLPLGSPRFADPAFVDELYELYLQVYEQSEIHFDLLTRDFFSALLQSRDIHGVVFLYRKDGELAGWNLCLIHNGLFIDKYIGLRYPLARELNLYFVSWMANLEYALGYGLRAYVAGWTDPEVKAGLGASFTFTRHLVRVKNPLLRRLLMPFRHLFESDGRALRDKARTARRPRGTP